MGLYGAQVLRVPLSSHSQVMSTHSEGVRCVNTRGGLGHQVLGGELGTCGCSQGTLGMKVWYLSCW